MTSIGNNVTYFDGTGTPRGALVGFADKDKNLANLIIVHDDKQKHHLLNSADFAHGLERKFSVPNAQVRADALAADRQTAADASCTEKTPEGEAQPGVTSEEVYRESFIEKDQTVTIATSSFSPSAAAKAKFAKAAAAGAGATSEPQDQ